MHGKSSFLLLGWRRATSVHALPAEAAACGLGGLWQRPGGWRRRSQVGVAGCEIHFAPPEKPWNDSIPRYLNAKQRYGFNHGFQVVRFLDLVPAMGDLELEQLLKSGRRFDFAGPSFDTGPRNEGAGGTPVGLLPYTKVPFGCRFFLSHSQMGGGVIEDHEGPAKGNQRG